jgi:hypothetical protein
MSGQNGKVVNRIPTAPASKSVGLILQYHSINQRRRGKSEVSHTILNSDAEGYWVGEWKAERSLMWTAHLYIPGGLNMLRA